MTKNAESEISNIISTISSQVDTYKYTFGPLQKLYKKASSIFIFFQLMHVLRMFYFMTSTEFEFCLFSYPQMIVSVTLVM